MTIHHPPVGVQPRFALLHHEMDAAGGRFDHWDLMLEHSGTLLTFELTKIPSGPGQLVTHRLKDHRLEYLDYEGHISGNRGQVYRIDRGRYREFHIQDPTHPRRFQYQLDGGRISALLACDQPLFLLPFGSHVELDVVKWELHD